MTKLSSLIAAFSNLRLDSAQLTKLASFQPVFSLPSKHQFFNPQSVSNGWISPDGKYFYNGSGHIDLIETAYRNSYPERAREIFTEQIKLAAPNEVDYGDVITAMYKDALLSGWLKVSNAYEASTGTPSREALNAFVELFLSYGNNEACEKDIYIMSSGYQEMFRGTVFDLERFTRSIRR